MFQTQQDARGWLAVMQAEIITEKWKPPSDAPARVPTVAEYVDGWLTHRTLAPRTRAHYRLLLDRHILPVFGTLSMTAVTADDVRRWHHPDNWPRRRRTAATKPTGTRRQAAQAEVAETLRAHCYGLLRSIFATAVSDGMVALQPCTIRGAGAAPTARKVRSLTVGELGDLTAAMPERLRLLVLLSAWCALRFGEATELRREDVHLDHAGGGHLAIRRGVVRVAGETVVGRPKTDASVRDVAIPPHVIPMVVDHLERFAAPGRGGLLFPAHHGGHLAPSTLYRPFYKARNAIGRGDLAVHHLRHVGASLAAASGASLRELMDRLGHVTPGASLRYQHAAAGRDREIADALSAMARAAAEGTTRPGSGDTP